MKKAIFAAFAAALAAPGFAAEINIVGSSTVYPFSTAAAELFAEETGGKTPKVEATGSGGGLKLFCSGGGAPDIANASRRIKKSERELCAKNGAGGILEIKIGYDGIVVAQSVDSAPMELTRRRLFLALARNVPDGSGNLAENPRRSWRDVDASLPDAPIRVYGPPPTSGTRDAFAELVLEHGCHSFPELKALKKSDKQKHKAVCHGVREDGAYIESGENDNLIIQKLAANPGALGVFGFSFLEENRDKVRGLKVENVAPEFGAIAAGAYPVSRPLFFYTKLSRYGAAPGLREFVEFFVSPEIMGEDGALVERGLIPLSDAEYEKTARDAQNQTPMPEL